MEKVVRREERKKEERRKEEKERERERKGKRGIPEETIGKLCIR